MKRRIFWVLNKILDILRYVMPVIVAWAVLIIVLLPAWVQILVCAAVFLKIYDTLKIDFLQFRLLGQVKEINSLKRELIKVYGVLKRTEARLKNASHKSEGKGFKYQDQRRNKQG
jgi:hypothetical protein